MRGIKKAVIEAAESLRDRLVALSDDFYRHPETGLKEKKTSAAMQAFLEDFGFSVTPGIAGMETAFKASYGSGAPVISILAEMDALPSVGHGCGHNIAGTASVGAGAALSIALKRVLKPGRGTVLVLGTPAEELGKGKIEMIKAGVFDGVDTSMMVHGSSKRTVVKHFLGLVRLNFTFHGRSSHASAYPEEGINALDAVILTFNGISALRQQLRTDVRVHGIITDGGKAPNIIPERAGASFYVRSNDLKELESVKQRVINCASGAATSTGCTVEVKEVGDLNAPMKLNHAFIETYRRALDFLGLKEDKQPPEKNVGSSDIGNVSQIIPTIHPHVPIKEGINIHTREFADATVTPDGHRALMEGVKCLGLTAVELLLDPEALEEVKRDFRGSIPPA
ncbi:MAG: M20 family metallopeptidase [Deltaproteobacteria bacterium]|nr:M20 family metallopeptidase [Deltaproteobacteria bacterium]